MGEGRSKGLKDPGLPPFEVPMDPRLWGIFVRLPDPTEAICGPAARNLLALQMLCLPGKEVKSFISASRSRSRQTFAIACR